MDTIVTIAGALIDLISGLGGFVGGIFDASVVGSTALSSVED